MRKSGDFFGLQIPQKVPPQGQRVASFFSASKLLPKF